MQVERDVNEISKLFMSLSTQVFVCRRNSSRNAMNDSFTLLMIFSSVFGDCS